MVWRDHAESPRKIGSSADVARRPARESAFRRADPSGWAPEEKKMRRFVQIVLYAQMAFVTFAAVVGFLAHQFPIAAQEQPLARQVGFLLVGLVITLWVISRFWQQEPRLLLIPIALSVVGLVHHGFDALIVNAQLDIPAPSGADIYPPLVADAVFLVLYIVGYRRTGSPAPSTSSPALANPA
jgi:hypothetical protein